MLLHPVTLLIAVADSKGGGGGGMLPLTLDLTAEKASELVEFAVRQITQLPEAYQLESVSTPLALPDQPADNPGLYFVALNYGDGTNAVDLTQHKQFPDMVVGCMMVAVPAAMVPIPLALAVIVALVVGLQPTNVLPVVMASLTSFSFAYGFGLFVKEEKEKKI